MKKQHKLSILFFTMLKIGAFTVGGGYAMIPLIEHEFVSKRGWVETDEMSNILALAQSIPGAISVNTSIIIGYRQKGLAGALCAIFGLALPSIITLSLITFLYQAFRYNIYIFAALRGIRACVVSLIFSAFVRLSKPVPKTIYTVSLFALSFLITLLTQINTVYIIVAGILIGLLSNIFIAKDKVDG
jgi:chromate transporter